jgi:hypothetical protein
LTYSGAQTRQVQTRGGRLFVSKIFGAQKFRMKRNVKTVKSGPINEELPPDLPSICTETTLATYGSGKDYTTDTLTRVSRRP